jgi:tetratricopeptide (TPR) repeat protein
MKLGYQNLASAMLAKGDTAGAIRVMEQSTANRAGGESMDRRRALLLSELGRPGEAVKVLKQYQESEDPETLNALGIALSDSGRPADALLIFARAIEIDPAGADGYQNTGIALLKLDRAAEARDQLEAALRFGKRHARAWNALGVAWLKLGDPGKAVKAWEQCTALNPEQYDALYNIGRVAGQMKDWKKARTALEKFVATAPAKQYDKDIAEVRGVLADMKRQGR